MLRAHDRSEFDSPILQALLFLLLIICRLFIINVSNALRERLAGTMAPSVRARSFHISLRPARPRAPTGWARRTTSATTAQPDMTPPGVRRRPTGTTWCAAAAAGQARAGVIVVVSVKSFRGTRVRNGLLTHSLNRIVAEGGVFFSDRESILCGG